MEPFYMTDEELLTLAAKAAGVEIVTLALIVHGRWDPLTDDGDALRLAVKLEMDIYVRPTLLWTEVVAPMCMPVRELHTCDPHAATRRAIVRAAAEVGRVT
jgi:hypothetical protein